MNEETVLLGNTNSLVGIIAHPDKKRADLPTVLLLNAGLIHRIGPNRLYVKLARQLSAIGFRVLRFDLSGIGDSKPRQDNLPFDKSAIDDTQQAMNYLERNFGTKSFILMGHCAGAANSLMTANQDERVVGTLLMNPEGANDDWSDFDRKRKVARYYQNYYTRGSLTSRDRWVKLLTGRVNYISIARNLVVNILWNKVSTLLFRIRKNLKRPTDTVIQYSLPLFRAIGLRGVTTLIIYPEGSTGLMRVKGMLYNELKDLSQSGRLQLEIIPQADHTYTLLSMQKNLLEVIIHWSEQFVKVSPEEIPEAVQEYQEGVI